MRYIKKRLTVKNDGFCRSKKPADERIMAVVERYVAKMAKKGWVPYLDICGGNAFFCYEAYVRMAKPKNQEGLIYLLEKVPPGFKKFFN